MKNYSSDSDIFRELLNPKMFLDSVSNGADNNSVTLTEEKAKDSEIVITNLPDDILIIKLDEFRCARRPSMKEIHELELIKDSKEKHDKSARANTAFTGNHGENECADYIMISQSSHVVLCLELKSSKAGGHAERQLKGAKCFLECCRLYISNFFENMHDDFLRDYQYRFVKCFKTSPKYLAQDFERRPRTTRHQSEKQPVPDTPEKAMYIKGRKVSFKKIAWIKCDL